MTYLFTKYFLYAKPYSKIQSPKISLEHVHPV